MQEKPDLGARTVSYESKCLNSLPNSHYQSLSELETSYWWHLSRLNWAEKFIKNIYTDTTTLNVLDYGCGTGGFLHELNKRLRFKSCLGVDVSDKAIKFAQKYGNNYTQLKPDFALPDDVDLILLMDVLEHCKDDESFLKSLLGSTKRKNYVLISVPALPCLCSEWDRTLGHYRRYTKESLKKLVSKVGGVVKNIGYCFSYLVPIIFFKRVILKTSYEKQDCRFQPTSNSLNRFLLILNRLEMLGAKYISYPFGSSLFCLFEKQSFVSKISSRLTD